MPRWLPWVLRRTRDLASRRRLRFTLKAQRELARLGFDGEDGRDILLRLTARDSVTLRTDCVIISFHEDSDGNQEENC
jgi:hypothetical protein